MGCRLLTRAFVVAWLGFAVVCAGIAGSAAAAARKPASKVPASVVLHPRFHLSRGSALVADQQYVFVSGLPFPSCQAGSGSRSRSP